MLIGYARVSMVDQNLDLQRDALKEAGCEKVYEDKENGAKAEREGLARALDTLQSGDTLVVWKLDRLGRSLKHLIETVQTLQAREVGFRSLQESVDTTSPDGKLVFHLFAALAEFERDIIRERTDTGLRAARARGKKGGRKPVLDAMKQEMAQTLRNDPKQSIGDICKTLGISRATFYRYTASASPTEAQKNF